MKKNVGKTDKLIRIIVAVVLVGLNLGGILVGTIGTIALIVGVIAALTSFMGVCPAYSLLGTNTNKED